jgi:hypothetical protein
LIIARDSREFVKGVAPLSGAPDESRPDNLDVK